MDEKLLVVIKDELIRQYKEEDELYADAEKFQKWPEWILVDGNLNLEKLCDAVERYYTQRDAT